MRLICQCGLSAELFLKKNEITSGAVYTPCGLSPGKYGTSHVQFYDKNHTPKQQLPVYVQIYDKNHPPKQRLYWKYISL